MKNIKLTEGLIDKIKQIIKDKKSDKQAIDDISNIIEAAPAIWGDDDKKQSQKIKVDEALHGKFDIEIFFKMAKDIGLETLEDLEKFLKNEKRPEDKDEWETMLRYRASLGNDFKIKEELTEDKETCVLCGKHIEGYGNNPAPLADEGKCCDECNKTKVIPARMKTLRGKKMNEAAEDKGNIKILGFNHSDPEYVYGICNLTADQAKKLEKYFEYIEDVSSLRGLYIVGNNDESFYFYDGSKYSTPKEWDEAVYQALVQDAKDNPDEDVLYVELGGLEVEIDKDRLEINKHHVTNMVKNSYIDGDSEAQFFFVNFTDTDIEPLDIGDTTIIVYDNFKNFKSDSGEEEEVDEMDYDDDYIIDYEDEPEEEMEYDDEYSFKR